MVVLLIVGITTIAPGSVLLGMDKGVNRLSEINMAMAVALFLFILFMSGIGTAISRYFSVMVDYVAYLPALSNPFGREDSNYFHGWTTFCWAWWIAWSPFVGIFIARISRGRTVREFVLCALIAPTLVCALWMSTFGGAVIDMIQAEAEQGITAVVVDTYKPEMAPFRLLDQYPLYSSIAPISLMLIVIFFVTSSDSGSLVIDTITAGGKMDAPVIQRIFWCTLGGLIMCYCLWLALRSERAKM